MANLDSFMGGSGMYTFNEDGSSGALHLYDPWNDGWLYEQCDLTDYTDIFQLNTSNFLDANPQYNVVIWSWCSLNTDFGLIDQYLTNMNNLEADYPDAHFVYMTGHLDGSGETGDVHLANERIRDFCVANDKILYDFADIESYNPDDVFFLDKGADDNCTYDSGNWALEWQALHDGINTQPNGGEWFYCSPAHSQAVNGNMKAYAAWYLFARLAGWDGN